MIEATVKTPQTMGVESVFSDTLGRSMRGVDHALAGFRANPTDPHVQAGLSRAWGNYQRALQERLAVLDTEISLAGPLQRSSARQRKATVVSESQSFTSHVTAVTGGFVQTPQAVIGAARGEIPHALIAGVPLALSVAMRVAVTGLTLQYAIVVVGASYLASLAVRKGLGAYIERRERARGVSKQISETRSASLRRKIGLGIVGGVASFLVTGGLLWEQSALHHLVDTIRGEVAPDYAAAPAGGRDGDYTCRAPDARIADEVLNKKVSHPLLTLARHESIATIKHNGGWFIINEGTITHPVYRLGRIYLNNEIRLGAQVNDLALLGRSTIYELPAGEVKYPGGAGLKLSPHAVTEKEMGVFYRMPEIHPQEKLEGYKERFNKRLALIRMPSYADVTGDIRKPAKFIVGDQGYQGLTPEEIKIIRNTIFDSVDVEKKQPSGLQPDGSHCYRPYYADTTALDPEHPGKLVTNEYPILRQEFHSKQSWVVAHEMGHAIHKIANMQDTFNSLPSWKRAQLLAEMKEFHQLLQERGYHRTATTSGTECFADLVAYYLKDPAFLKKVAPNSARFIQNVVNNDPLLRKLILFT